MKREIKISNRIVKIDLSNTAEHELAKRDQPLLAEMELYFSCFIRKQVRFRELADDADIVSAGEHLSIRFRPVMTAQCKVSDLGANEAPPVTDFPIVRPELYIPKWLKIDFKKGKWVGEFGYIH